MNDEQRKLAEDNINLVYFTLKKYFNLDPDDEDAISAGMEGLCIAAEGFDPERGKFSTYAAQCIRNCVRTELRSRQKHTSNVYLSNVTIPSEETDTTFDEYHGEEDEGFEDLVWSDQMDGFERILSEEERLVLRLTKDGETPLQIAMIMGVNRSKIYSVLREIKSLWRKYK